MVPETLRCVDCHKKILDPVDAIYCDMCDSPFCWECGEQIIATGICSDCKSWKDDFLELARARPGYLAEEDEEAFTTFCQSQGRKFSEVIEDIVTIRRAVRARVHSLYIRAYHRRYYPNQIIACAIRFSDLTLNARALNNVARLRNAMDSLGFKGKVKKENGKRVLSYYGIDQMIMFMKIIRPELEKEELEKLELLKHHPSWANTRLFSHWRARK